MEDWMERTPVALLHVDLGELGAASGDSAAARLESVPVLASNARARTLLTRGERPMPSTLAGLCSPEQAWLVESRLLAFTQTRQPVQFTVSFASGDDDDATQPILVEVSIAGDANERSGTTSVDTGAVLSLLVLPDKDAEHQRFVDTLSHDLQEPLRMVVSFAELLEKRSGSALDERGTTYLNYMVDGARRMQGMLGALLSLARVESRGKELTPTDTALALHSAIRRLEPDIESMDAQVTHDELPIALADQAQLAEVFGCLIHNSLLFRGTEAPRIHVRAEREVGAIRFSVADNGEGMPAEHLEAVFTIFRQLHPRGEKPGVGSGTGLTIARAIVRRHGGRIWLTSEPGRGTTACFTLLPTR